MIDLGSLTVEQLHKVLMNTVHNHAVQLAMIEAEMEGLRAENKVLRDTLANQVIGVLMRGTFRTVEPGELSVERQEEPEEQEEEPQPNPEVVFIDAPTKGYQA